MIRTAIPSEIDAIMDITKACAQKMISEGIFQWNESYPNSDTFYKDVERGELYVLLSEARIIGCIVISSEKDAEYDQIAWLTKDRDNFYIHRLAIHPDYQHRGYAKKCMDFAEELARKKGGRSIRLDTFSQNKRNQKFYEARGYKKLGNVYFPRQSEYPFPCYELVLAT